MDVLVSPGTACLASVLSVKLAGVRRQVALQSGGSKLRFPQLRGSEEMQVDVYSRVGSSKLEVHSEQESYEVKVDTGSEGVTALNFRFISDCSLAQSDAAATSSSPIMDWPMMSSPTPSWGSDDNKASAAKQVRRQAQEYIDRFDLRRLLTDLFQRSVKERPEDPFEFMRGLLLAEAGVAGTARSAQAERDLHEQVRVLTHDRDIIKSVLQRTEQDVEVLRQRCSELETALKVVTDKRLAAEAEVASKAAELDLLRKREHDARSEAAAAARQATAAARVVADGRAVAREGLHTPPGDVAAGASKKGYALSDSGTDIKKVAAPQGKLNEANDPLSETTASLSSLPAFGTTLDSVGGYTSSTIPTSVRGPLTEVNTHMLSQLLAASYAPPVAPTMYYEQSEEKDEDTDGLSLKPELLVDIVDCLDKSTNGTYGWVGDCNKRPLYRLIAAEPRYLYYADVDPTWAGWWIANKLGADEYVEWFREPAHATLPVHCKPGELGSRVTAAPLSREVVQKISTIGSQQEKVAMRQKLTEAFGFAFTRLDGSQRGLMSKTSPVVGIAHTLEAQQRAIQLLHSSLAAETKRREAAEVHATTMEEAFEALQLKIQAKFGPCLADAQ